MSFIGRIQKRVRAAAARSRLERDMQDEMREHIAQAAERLGARGMSPADAMAAARREFGNVGVLQEQARDARGARWIESVLGDLRHAARQFARAPLMAATIVLTLTLGIGVTSAAFATLTGMLTRPAPGVPSDPSLVAIRGMQAGNGRRFTRGFSYPELIEYSRLPEFADVAGWTTSMVVTEFPGQEGGTAIAEFVTPNFFRTLGLQLTGGPGFAQKRVDDRNEPELTAVITRIYASEKFGAPDSAVGRTVKVNGFSVRIVGVAPPRFLAAFGDGVKRTLFMPLSAWPIVDGLKGDAFAKLTEASFQAAGRLREGVSMRHATPAAGVIAARFAEATPRAESSTGRREYSTEVVPIRPSVGNQSEGEVIQAVAMIVAVVVLILLVCTTTVSSLLVGTAVTRRHEIAVRLALGASRARIVRQLLTESATLSVIAGAAGLFLYALICRGLRDSMSDINVDPTWTTAIATTAFAMITAMMCGLSPALHATREEVSGVLKDSSTTATVRSRLQRVFVVAQIALTQPLLIGLAMMIAVVSREGGHNNVRDLGEYVVSARFDNWSAASRSEKRMPAVIARISALPGVVAVIPQVTGVRIFKMEVAASGQSVPRRMSIRTRQVPPGYFKAMDVSVMRGREFQSNDTAATVTPIVIGSDFATQAFGAADPIGKRFATLTWDGKRKTGEAEVVGVVAATDVGDSEYGSTIRIFIPNGGPLGVPDMNADALLIRTANLAAPLIPTFREIARAEAPMMPAQEMKTLAQIDRETRSEIIEATGASAAGGLITLLLASVGLYAVVALGVSQRKREIGVRISLGASPSQVVALFFRGGLRVSLLGLAIGLPLSAVALRILAAEVGVPRTNMPVIAASVAMTVVAVASLASWIPARRAAGVDPLVALRDG